jgi:hypothetical protein
LTHCQPSKLSGCQRLIFEPLGLASSTNFHGAALASHARSEVFGPSARVTATRGLQATDPALSRLLAAEAKRRDKFQESNWSIAQPYFDGPIYQRQLRIFNSLTPADAAKSIVQALALRIACVGASSST